MTALSIDVQVAEEDARRFARWQILREALGNTSGPINRVLSAVAAEIRTASTAAEDGPS